MATINAEIPRVRNRNREFVLGDQPAGTGPDATATIDAETFIGLDDRIHGVGGIHVL
jgi:hypothetical protein